MLNVYFCPVCTEIKVSRTTLVGAYHRKLWNWRHETHAMLEAGTYPGTMTLEAIKADVLKQDWQKGVREIEVTSNELPRDTVKYEPAPKWARELRRVRRRVRERWTR